MANISTLIGPKPNSEGLSAGWSLFVVYEDPILPAKYITSFDGFTKITASINETFPVSGFTTIPVGPVRAKFAFGTIEGDQSYTGDYLRLNGSTIDATNNAGTVIRPGNNFFNSSVSIIDPATNTPELFTQRNPTSSNTLGFDAGIINIPNPGNSLIANGATSASISLGSNLDIYYYYFSAFAIEIIAPNIVLTKIVEDDLGNDIGGQSIGLDQPLNYIIGFQNTGNDDATNFQIRDVLPINIVYNHPTDLVLPAGVTVASYNATTRELVFDIDDSLVEENDPVYEIRIEVRTVEFCSQLADSCDNLILNQAFATYEGVTNPDFVITDDPSVSSNTGCLLTPQATNFLVDLDDCTLIEEIVLCGNSIDLTAGDGYDSYSWSTSPTGTPVVGTNQTFTATATGTYYSFNTAPAPCQSIVQQFNVTLFSGNATNPVIPYADEVVTCPNDGKELPNIFLCGTNDSRDIQTNIAGVTSMIWEQLDESSCDAVTDSDCANEDATCTWNQVATGPNYIADTAGQFRLTINYEGGCFEQFYFNVYTNLLSPSVTTTDIICNTPGSITVNNVPSGYEYSLDGTNYQASNIFSVNTAGTYTVYVRQIGIPTNPCVFTVPDVLIRARDFTVSSTVTQPICYDDLGSIYLAANDADPQYFFSIYDGATLVNTVGPIVENNYSFTNLNPGTYSVLVETEDGCTYTEDITIVQPPELTVSAAITTPLTCTDGEITIYPEGGTPPYFYFINSTTDFQTTPEYIVTTSGTYDITVVDSNNCSASTTVTIDAIPPPEFNVTKTDINCNGASDGTININVTNTNGNSLEFSIDGGTNFFNSPVFAGLDSGDYDVVVQYTIGASVCTTDPQTITINEPDAIVLDYDAVDITCGAGGLSQGSIIINSVTGGTAPYTYYVTGTNGYSNSETNTSGTTSVSFDVVDFGLYEINVIDANGCSILVQDVLVASPPTDLDISVTATVDCASGGTAVVSVGSTLASAGPFHFSIYQGPISVYPNPAGSWIPEDTVGSQSATFTGLTPGITYTFIVYDESTLCSYYEPATTPIPTNSTLTLSAESSNNITCTGSADGNVSFTVNSTYGAPVNVDYQIFDALTLQPIGATGSDIVPAGGTLTVTDFETLPFGNYFVSITETSGPNSGCGVVTAPFNITESEILLELATSVDQNADCNGSSGVISAIAQNGTPPYQYQVTATATAPLATDTNWAAESVFITDAGSYYVHALDAFGCIVTADVTVEEPDPIDATFTPSTTLLACYGDQDASITVSNVTGGQGSGYTYTLNTILPTPSTSGPQTSNVFNDLGAGTYSVTITDGLECIMTSVDIVITEPTPIDATLVVATTQTCLTDSSLTLSATGGTGQYTYSADSSFTTILGTFNTSITFPVSPGIYQFYVRDANGCLTRVSNEITIDSLPDLEINLESTNPTINCAGDNNGTIVATAEGGLGNYVYTLEDTAGNTITATQNSPGVFTELVAGTYVVHVESGDCDALTAPITITEPTNPLAVDYTINNVTCTGSNDGILEINASGGTGIIKYAISPQLDQFFETNIFEDLAPGTYTVIVQDELGCYEIFEFTINDPEQVLLSIVPDSLFEETCEGDANGEFSVEISGGSLPYSVSLDNYDGPYTTGDATQTVFDFTDLSGGDHTVFVRDAEGCETEWNITFPETIAFDPKIEVAYSCENNTTVNTVTVTVDGDVDPSDLDYSLNGGPYQLSNVFTNIPSGDGQYINVRHTNSCVRTTELFDMGEIEPITLVLQEGDEVGEIVAIVTGGTGEYQFTMNDEDYGITDTYLVTEEGTYIVVVTDSSGCQATAMIEIEIVGPCIPNYFTPNGDGTSDTWGPECTEGFPNLTFDIFDRYGRKVATYRVGEYWDGRYQGKELPTGDYWYVVKPNNAAIEKEYVGHFTLYR